MSRRHLEVLRAWKRYLIRGGYSTVHEEPLLRPLPPGAIARSGTTLEMDARADLVARGEGGRDWYFDVAVIDSGAPSYLKKTLTKVLQEYEEYKLRKYADRVAPLGAFSPLVCTVYGTLAPSAALSAHRVAHGVDPDRDERSSTVDLHAAVLQASIIKATSLCLRGRAWTSLPLVDVADPIEDASGSLVAAKGRDPEACWA